VKTWTPWSHSKNWNTLVSQWKLEHSGLTVKTGTPWSHSKTSKIQAPWSHSENSNTLVSQRYTL